VAHHAVTEVAVDVETGAGERRVGLEVDRGDNRICLQVGGQRLVDDHFRQHHRRDRVETESARIAAFVHADHRHAVDRDRGPAVGRAAHLDVAFLTLVALNGDAGQAGEGAGSGLVGETGGGVGGGDVGHVDGDALGFDRGLLRGEDRAGDDDLVSGLVRLFIGLAGFIGMGRYGMGHCECCQRGKSRGAQQGSVKAFHR